MAKIVIGLAGPPGVGKSRLGKFMDSEEGRLILAKYVPNHDLRYIPEQSDDAARELFYKNMQRFAIAQTETEKRLFYIEMQNCTDEFELIQARLRILRHRVMFEHEGIGVLDTTLISGGEGYRRNSFSEGFLTHKANIEYDHAITEAADSLGRDPERLTRWCETLLIFIEANVDIQYKRQSKRGDDLVPKPYLEKLNIINKTFIKKVLDSYNLDGTLKPVDERKDPYTHYGLMPPEILRLDGRKDIMLEPDTMKDHLEIIGKKLAEMLKNKEDKKLIENDLTKYYSEHE